MTPEQDRLSPEQEAEYRERVAGRLFYRGGPVDNLLRELDAIRAERDAARNALLLTVTNVKPSPHWCPREDGTHDPTCRGMQAAMRGEMALPRLIPMDE